MENIQSTYLIGHEEPEKTLFEAWKNNHLHNSWIFSGVKGIGKRTLAYKFALFLLKNTNKTKANNIEVNPNDPVFKLVFSNSHPDFKLLERDFIDTEKRKILKAIKSGEALSDDELDSMKKSAYIRVDEVREINQFLSKKSSLDGWRVVIVDSVDDLNNAGANAILKILEEPPLKTIIILISHNSTKLLPTILSRCANLNLKPLNDNNLASLIRRHYPETKEEDIKDLVKISSGSISKAGSYIEGNAIGIYKDLCDIIYAKERFSTEKLLTFCQENTKTEEKFELTKELVLKFISEHIKTTENIRELGSAWDYAIKVFDELDRLNLEKKQSLINIIHNIIKAI